MTLRRGDGTIFTPSTLHVESEMYTQYLPSVGSADQSLRDLVQYDVGRQERSALFPTRESRSKFWEMFGIVGC